MLPFDAASLSQPYNSMILAGVGQTASARGYALALYYADHHARDNYARSMRDGRVDGGLVIDSTLMTSEEIAGIAAERFPVIMIGHRLADTGVSYVAADDRGAAVSVVNYLISLGHERIVHIHFAGGHPTHQRRLGFIEAMASAGLLRDDSIIEDTIGDSPNLLDHSPLVQTLLDRPERPTAIFAWNDTVAASIVQCVSARGVRVPEDLSIVGYNDFVHAQLTTPPLTTVRQPLFEMGRDAADLLIDRIEATRAGTESNVPIQHVLPAELVVRQSTATHTPAHE